MILDNFNKQPADVLDYDVTYADWMATADYIAATATAVSPTGTIGDLNIDAVTVNEPIVKIWVSAGRSGMTYKVTLTTTTTSGRVRQDEFKVRVKEI